MTHKLPLLQRDLDQPIAYLTKPIESFSQAAGVVDTRTFLRHVHALAAQLQDKQYAINLCENRYLFLVSFCALIVRGQTNVLPPNKNVLTQESLKASFSDIYIVHDGQDIPQALEQVNLAQLQLAQNQPRATATPTDIIPMIPDTHLACICFTSGSTGQSQQIVKYWKTLYHSSIINCRHMLDDTKDTLYQLATVPAQHMWGLETSVLIPLFAKVCTSDVKPLFPQDILDTLATLPMPRMLVSTPIHLRALSSQDDQEVSISLVLCATSPLAAPLASAIEKQYKAILHEVYGCSEVGSMAVRRTANEQHWHRFEGISFISDGEKTLATAEHLHESTVLQDIILPKGDSEFVLSGRSSDLIKIAGKRGSLLEINQVLLSFDGLEDGVVMLPESTGATTRLCAIVALKEGVKKSELSGFLRERLDSAFVPRPIYLVKSLPRQSNGKLTKSAIQSLLKSLLKTKHQ